MISMGSSGPVSASSSLGELTALLGVIKDPEMYQAKLAELDAKMVALAERQAAIEAAEAKLKADQATLVRERNGLTSSVTAVAAREAQFAKHSRQLQQVQESVQVGIEKLDRDRVTLAADQKAVEERAALALAKMDELAALEKTTKADLAEAEVALAAAKQVRADADSLGGIIKQTVADLKELQTAVAARAKAL